MKKTLLLLGVFFLLLTSVYAEPVRVISNSNDWRDVYSTLLYGNLQGKESNFLVSTGHSTLLLYGISKGEEIEVISSEDNRFIVGYDEIIRSQGYPQESAEYVYDSVNFELAQRLDQINKYIIVDDSYGYNALSAAPYAAAAKYYVLFVDDRNVNRVVNFLEEKNPEDIIIFGNVDREVKDALAQFNPEIINKGDRFDNNFAIVDKFLEIKPTKQAILTSGEFIESSMMTGFDPVIFIGKSNVPEKVQNYIKQSDIDVGILIGNELVGVATSVRRQVGISVFVKFAQGSRRPTGAISQVEDLDRFPMPSFDLNVDIDTVEYNTATGSLEVTYKNNVDIGTFVKGTIRVQDGGDTKLLADEESFYIEGDEIKTIAYDTQTNGDDFFIAANEATANIFAVYGEATNALEYQVERNFDIQFIDVIDNSDLEIVSATYDKTKKGFVVTVENVGGVETYVTTEIYDLIVNDEEGTYASGDVPLLKPGEKAKLFVDVEMVDEDFLDNEIVYVRAFYGERNNALFKITEAEFPLEFSSSVIVYVIVIVVIILIILLLLFLRKKCKHCKTKNFILRTKCKKCKAKI